MIDRYALPAAVVVTGLCALVLEERAAAQHQRDQALAVELRSLRELASVADNRALSALLTRVELSYDPLVDALKDVRARSRRLEHVPHLAPLRERLDATEARVEILKQRRSGHQNAQQYVEVLLSEAKQSESVADVHRHLALYLINPSPERQAMLRAHTEQVAEGYWTDLDTLGKHLEILLEARRQLDNLARELLAGDLGTPAAEAVRKHEAEIAEQEANRQRTRVFLLAVMVMLALVFLVRITRHV